MKIEIQEQKNKGSEILKYYDLMAIVQALLKQTVDSNNTVERMQRLFITPTSYMGVKVLAEQKEEYHARVVP